VSNVAYLTDGQSAGPAICPVCWLMVDTFRNEQGAKVLYAHRRPATNSKRCPGSHRVARERAGISGPNGTSKEAG
jgi:hypothetical protein